MPLSSETVSDGSRRQYHIGLAPGDAENYILLCGDPDRAEKVAKLLDSVRLQRQHREFVTFTGTYKGIPATVMATGIGPDNTDIVVNELGEIVERPTFIRIGSCGALQPATDLGELIISHEAMRGHENTSDNYAPRSLRALSDPFVERALVRACRGWGMPYRVGTTCTTSSFYAGQGRKPRRIPRIRNPGLAEQLGDEGVENFEMETSALFTIAHQLTGFSRAGAVCAAYANRRQGVFGEERARDEAEQRVIKAGLTAIELLARDDAKRRSYVIEKGGKAILSDIPGRYAGHRPGKIFGTLDCPSGMRMKPENRVFFHHILDAIEQGYRPCKKCLPISAADAQRYLKGTW